MTQIYADEENGGRDPQTYAVIGAAMDVHSQLGRGFLEPVYQAALEVEFTDRGIPFAREVKLPIYYKGRLLTCFYKADFVCYDSIIAELKALNELSSREQSQAINYLKATGRTCALLLNFGPARLEYKRMVFSSHLH